MDIKEFVEKLSSYNLFNYFFPGLIFVAILMGTTHFNLYQNDVLIGVFLYYFIGLVISRIGSIVIEPVLWKIGFAKKNDIPKLIRIMKDNIKIELLYQVSNMYRTIASMFLVLTGLKGYDIIKHQELGYKNLSHLLLGILLFILFLFAFRKQNEYVYECVVTEPGK